LTIEPHFNYEQYVEALVTKKVPPEEAQAIAQSLEFLENAAYFVPKGL
jgi:hypothetical protein